MTEAFTNGRSAQQCSADNKLGNFGGAKFLSLTIVFLKKTIPSDRWLLKATDRIVIAHFLRKSTVSTWKDWKQTRRTEELKPLCGSCNKSLDARLRTCLYPWWLCCHHRTGHTQDRQSIATVTWHPTCCHLLDTSQVDISTPKWMPRDKQFLFQSFFLHSSFWHMERLSFPSGAV